VWRRIHRYDGQAKVVEAKALVCYICFMKRDEEELSVRLARPVSESHGFWRAHRAPAVIRSDVPLKISDKVVCLP
jgi:hypothetical protein